MATLSKSFAYKAATTLFFQCFANTLSLLHAVMIELSLFKMLLL